ncbi:hypothetical protein [Phyllobacterium zundukense]|uniref:Uncharacterized protein n=1 Tax=Phyllobacterium zundukense TaxID=1867719 RepID=A0ACD4CVZ5_9HYPH|nr:hypothetical protein [Phyllobacterium zundukense]UXN57771.1 hypothetical protein N8E88_02910 [Phyllobacterium zundukense]
MIRMTLSLFLLAGLTGCASISYPLPKCDGYSRRPLNRAMWQWEDKSTTKQPASEADPTTSTNRETPYVEEQETVTPAAFEQFDAAGSFRHCGRRVRW